MNNFEQELKNERDVLKAIHRFQQDLLTHYGIETLEEWIEAHGLTYKQYMNSNMWRITSYFKKRLIGKCEVCGAKHSLCVHHLRYDNLGFEIFHLEDLQVLCDDCHRKAHDIYGGQSYYRAGDILKHEYPMLFDKSLLKKSEGVAV